MGNYFSLSCFPLFCRQSLHFSKKSFFKTLILMTLLTLSQKKKKFALVHLKPHFSLKAKVKANRKLL